MDFECDVFRTAIFAAKFGVQFLQKRRVSPVVTSEVIRVFAFVH
jgi:hypothetical protein